MLGDYNAKPLISHHGDAKRSSVIPKRDFGAEESLSFITKFVRAVVLKVLRVVLPLEISVVEVDRDSSPPTEGGSE